MRYMTYMGGVYVMVKWFIFILISYQVKLEKRLEHFLVIRCKFF